MIDAPISLQTELPESLYSALQKFLDQHPRCSQDQALAAGLCLFLMQNGAAEPAVSQIYLDSLFGPNQTSLSESFAELREQFGDDFATVDSKEDLL